MFFKSNPSNGAKNLIGIKSCKPKCKFSQVINSQKSEVDPQEIDEENLFKVRKGFVTKIKMIKSVHKWKGFAWVRGSTLDI